MTFRWFETEVPDRLAGISGEAEGSRYAGDREPLSFELTALWIARSIMNVDKFGYGTGALVEKATNKIIGWAGFADRLARKRKLFIGLRSHTGVGFRNRNTHPLYYLRSQ